MPPQPVVCVQQGRVKSDIDGIVNHQFFITVLERRVQGTCVGVPAVLVECFRAHKFGVSSADE